MFNANIAQHVRIDEHDCRFFRALNEGRSDPTFSRRPGMNSGYRRIFYKKHTQRTFIYISSGHFPELMQLTLKEWELFGLKGGIAGFLLFNIFAASLLLYGFILVIQGSPNGILFSFLMGVTGVFTFLIHFYFINKGRKEFTTATSLSILAAILIVSLIQILLSALLFF